MAIEVVQIPKKEWKQIVEILNKFQQQTEEDYISEQEAADFMGLKLNSFRNRVYAHEIPSTAYKLTHNGKRVYKKSLLLKDI